MIGEQLHLGLCADLPVQLGYLAICQEALLEDGKAPEWIPLVPAGDNIDALDGRKFSNSKPEEIVKAFNEDPRDMPVDWNHAEEIKAPKGEEAPAAGWVKELEIRKGSIWGRVDWGPKGAESLKNKEYRYISPAFMFDKVKNIIKLVSAALVNRPAFDMPAVAHSQIVTQEKKMNPELLKLLGLTEEATEDQIKTAIESLVTDPKTELEAAKKELETASAKLQETEEALANARNANPELDKFVPRADYDAVTARAKKLEDEKAEAAKEAHEKAVASEVGAAMKDGKIVPASKDHYLAICSTEEGLAQFRKLVETMPVVGEPSDLDDKQPPKGDVTITEEELAIASNCGLTKEEYLEAKGIEQ